MCVKGSLSTELATETMIVYSEIIIQWQMVYTDVNLTLQWYLTVKNNLAAYKIKTLHKTNGSVHWLQLETPWTKSTHSSMLIPQLRDF